MHANLVKYHVYQQLEADEHKAICYNLMRGGIWHMLLGGTLNMDIEIFSFLFVVTTYQHLYCLFIVVFF